VIARPRPRQPVHRGSVLASALAVSLAHVEEREARRRILALGANLAEVVRAEEMLIALLREPQRVQCEACDGMPLVKQGALWSAAPLLPDELEALPAQQEAIVLIEGGFAHALPLDELRREDPVAWLDVSSLQPSFELRSLGELAAAPGAALVEVQLDTRDALGLGPLSAESQQLLRSLRERGGQGGGGGGGGSTSNAGAALDGAGLALTPARAGWMTHLRDRLAAALDALVSRLPGRGALSSSAGAAFGSSSSRSSAASSSSFSSGRGHALVTAPPPRSWLGRAVDALGSLAARAVMRTQLRNVLGRRYARYLEKIFDMFDGNQLDEALRHAIPLGGAGGAGEALRRLPWNPPGPRPDLALSPQRRSAASTSLGFGAEIYDALKARYRRAFERLRDQGDFEKAAFVLAELLHADEEAVSFLEKHDKLRLAAELAEARGLPPGLVIRQWFLARDPARALRLARKSGAFADAVARLEASHPEEARALRLLWADALAAGGAYPAAVDVVWPMESARHLAAAWIDRAIEIGGVSGARMLVRKLRLLPASFAEVRDRVLALFEDEALEPHVLEAFTAELLAGEPTAELRVLMRAASRRLLRERGEVGGPRLVPRLLEACGDPVLRIDAGPVIGIAIDEQQSAVREGQDAAVALARRASPLELHWSAADRGAVAILDACELPDGKLLVALGELGAWLLSREGRVLARFSEPAHQLVPSDHGDRAILVAPRGETVRLARVDLLARRARPWCDVQLDAFAADYDGATWFVSRGGTVYAIEALGEAWSHAWKVHEQDAVVHALRRDAQALHVWFVKAATGPQAGTIGELWRYELPQLVLRQRALTPFDPSAPLPASISPAGFIATWQEAGAGEARRPPRPAVLVEGKWRAMPASSKALLALRPQLDRELAAFAESCSAPPPLGAGFGAAPAGTGVCVTLFDIEEGEPRARLFFHGKDETPPIAGFRFAGARLLVFDSLGRLLALSLNTGETIRRLRLW
jgi:hypothetical protein